MFFQYKQTKMDVPLDDQSEQNGRAKDLEVSQNLKIVGAMWWKKRGVILRGIDRLT